MLVMHNFHRKDTMSGRFTDTRVSLSAKDACPQRHVCMFFYFQGAFHAGQMEGGCAIGTNGGPHSSSVAVRC